MLVWNGNALWKIWVPWNGSISPVTSSLEWSVNVFGANRESWIFVLPGLGGTWGWVMLQRRVTLPCTCAVLLCHTCGQPSPPKTAPFGTVQSWEWSGGPILWCLPCAWGEICHPLSRDGGKLLLHHWGGYVPPLTSASAKPLECEVCSAREKNLPSQMPRWRSYCLGTKREALADSYCLG